MTTLVDALVRLLDQSYAADAIFNTGYAGPVAPLCPQERVIDDFLFQKILMRVVSLLCLVVVTEKPAPQRCVPDGYSLYTCRRGQPLQTI